MTYEEIFRKCLEKLEEDTLSTLEDKYKSCVNWCDFMEKNSKNYKVEVTVPALASLKAQFEFVARILKEMSTDVDRPS